MASCAVPCAFALRFPISSSSSGLPTLGYLTYFESTNANGSIRSLAEVVGAATASLAEECKSEEGAGMGGSIVDAPMSPFEAEAPPAKTGWGHLIRLDASVLLLIAAAAAKMTVTTAKIAPTAASPTYGP